MAKDKALTEAEIVTACWPKVQSGPVSLMTLAAPFRPAGIFSSEVYRALCHDVRLYSHTRDYALYFGVKP